MMQLKIYIIKTKEEIVILVYMLVVLLEIVKRGWNWNTKRSINWINNKVFKSNTMDVILQHTSIDAINENERMIISTSNTDNYSDDPSITDNDNNDNNN